MGILRDEHYYINNPTRTEYVTKEVNINRQSTADDARLLKELEQEAQAKIDDIVYKKIDALNMNYAQVEVTLMPQRIATKMIFICYELNGMKCKHEIKYEEFQPLSLHEQAVKVHELKAKDISNLLIESALKQFPQIRGY